MIDQSILTDEPDIPRRRPDTESRKRNERFIRKNRRRWFLRSLVRPAHPTIKRVVVVSVERSGSHLVGTLLSCHPEIRMYNELLQKEALAPRRAVEWAFAAAREPVVGFLLKPNQFSRQRGGVDRWLSWLEERDFRPIHLIRTNVLRRALSQYLARERLVWIHKPGDPAGLEPVIIDLGLFEEFMDYQRYWAGVHNKWIDRLGGLTINYESDLRLADCHQRTADRVFEFLGLESVPVTAGLQRIVPDDPTSFVENWDEVVASYGRVE